MPLFSLAKLSDEQIKMLQDYEKETGKKVLAFSPMDVEPAALKQDEVKRLQSLEKKLDVTLVAVQ